jgi:hypothetical protein
MGKRVERKIVYKVCYKKNGKFYSMYHNELDGLSVEYGIGKDSAPKAGKLFAFLNKDDALSKCCSNHIAFEAEAIVIKEMPVMHRTVMAIDKYSRKSFEILRRDSRNWWKWVLGANLKEGYIILRETAPKGVILGWQCSLPFLACSRIRLIRQISEGGENG